MKIVLPFPLIFPRIWIKDIDSSENIRQQWQIENVTIKHLLVVWWIWETEITSLYTRTSQLWHREAVDLLRILQKHIFRHPKKALNKNRPNLSGKLIKKKKSREKAEIMRAFLLSFLWLFVFKKDLKVKCLSYLEESFLPFSLCSGIHHWISCILTCIVSDKINLYKHNQTHNT